MRPLTSFACEFGRPEPGSVMQRMTRGGMVPLEGRRRGAAEGRSKTREGVRWSVHMQPPVPPVLYTARLRGQQ